MAEEQRSGQAYSEEHLAFINRAVAVDVNCNGTVLEHSGWYSELHFDPLEAVKSDPIITDVHTDVGGDIPVSRPPKRTARRHGSTAPNVVDCRFMRGAAGIVASYHGLLSDGLNRLTDEEWQKQQHPPPPGVDWMAPVLVRE